MKNRWVISMWLALFVFGGMSLAYSAKEEQKAVDVQQVLSEANSLISENETDKAVELLKQASESAPEDSSIMRRITEIYLASGENDKAKSNLIKILTSQDFADLGGWAAVEYYNAAQKSSEPLDAAIKKLKDAGANNKKNKVLQIAIAEGYVRLKDWSNVANVYEELCKNYPADGGLAVRLRDVYMILKDYEPVIKALEPAVKADPKNIGNSDILAHAYVGAGRGEDAIKLYEQKISEEGAGPGLLGRYAQALMDFNRLDEAIEQWKKAAAIDSQNLFFKQRTAEIYLKQGKLNEAKKEWTELLGLIPEKQAAFKEMIQANLKAIDDLLSAEKR